jgi:hypothetical protein
MHGKFGDVAISDGELGGDALEHVEPSAVSETAFEDLGNICKGCENLKARVEHLEQLFSEITASQSTPAATQLGTTTCYWTVVGLHSFVLVCMLTGMAAMLAYPFILGAVGTLTTCHALTVRPVLMKWLRSLLSVAVVSLCALLPLRLLGASGNEVFPLVLIGLPLVLAPALLGSQLFVWIVGWQVLPPGTKSNERPRFRILDILGITFIAALYATLFQFASFEDFDFDLADGGWQYLGATLLMCMLVGVVATLCARSFLVTGPSTSKLWLLYAGLTALMSAIALVSLFFFMVVGTEVDLSELFLTLVVYVGGGSIVCLTSPVVTFLFMRLAGYRMVFPRTREL